MSSRGIRLILLALEGKEDLVDRKSPASSQNELESSSIPKKIQLVFYLHLFLMDGI